MDIRKLCERPKKLDVQKRLMVRPQTYLTINLPNRDQVGINSGSIQGRFGVDSGSIWGRFGVERPFGRMAVRPNRRSAERPNGRSADRPNG